MSVKRWEKVATRTRNKKNNECQLIWVQNIFGHKTIWYPRILLQVTASKQWHGPGSRNSQIPSPPSLRRSYQFDKIAHLDHKSVGHNGQDNLHISSSIHYRRLSHCAHHHDVCRRRQRSPFNSLFIESIDVLCGLLTVYPGKRQTVNAKKRWMAACKHIFQYQNIWWYIFRGIDDYNIQISLNYQISVVPFKADCQMSPCDANKNSQKW